ncbi:MAG: hypothetical protein GAK43_02512 [Stenotrophomonas maltophilia]|nr:MAG: hypothetical protein GAK43_02512 [Stenotrophomonas maltophilia]
MQILDNRNDLAGFLGQQRDKRITIVTAFAAGTEALVERLREAGNRLDIVVGTINSFTSPDFIEYCIGEASDALSLSVDFRYQRSVHWKLYLIEPDIVVLGSANFTEIGVGLSRDNAVVVQDATLYNDYLARVLELKTTEGVLPVGDTEAFDAELETYRWNHRRMQAGLARTAQYLDGESWLGDESNQSIPLFIWYSDHSEDSESTAERHLRTSSGVDWDDVREFFTYECAEGALPYEEGDVVLTARVNGSHIGFYTFDRILYRDGTYFIYSYRKKRYPAPFNLDDTKDGLKDEIPRWYEEGRTEMNRADILRLMI